MKQIAQQILLAPCTKLAVQGYLRDFLNRSILVGM